MSIRKKLMVPGVALLALSALAIAVGPWHRAIAQVTTPVIVEVQEEWSLQLNTPDGATGSPQIATQMMPHKGYPDAFAIFSINYQEVPDFKEGGIEIQLWDGDLVLDDDGETNSQLSTDNETLTWTQYLKIHDSKLEFGVKNGVSSSYGGSFGNSEFKVAHPIALNDLANYVVEDSVKHSGITLGSNRVKHLKLTKVTYIKSDGTKVVDTNIRKVHEESAN